MTKNVLREFFRCSREWARAEKGLELFQMAAANLKDIGQIDSGFIVYHKRLLSNENTSPGMKVYTPWGVFAKSEEWLPHFLDSVSLAGQAKLDSIKERWMQIRDLPHELKLAWSSYGICQIGIWPLISQEKMMGAIVVARTKVSFDSTMEDFGTELLDASAAQISMALDLILARRIAEEASERDLLTGLLNRRGLTIRLPQLIEQSKRTGSYLVFGLTDLDSLKYINDTKGHPAGDEALRQVAHIISRNVRTGDLVARFGGDEFVVVLQVDKPEAKLVMNRVQEAVYRLSDGFSVSVGGAVWGIDGDSLDTCYQIADEKLYESKRMAKRVAR